MGDEKGYIKFDCQWVHGNVIEHPHIDTLIEWRNQLYKKSLIGCYDNGIGYGNISIRYDEKTFLITGSATGQFEDLKPEHITLVTDYNFDNNSLVCQGPIKASSESLTHAIIYKSSPEINAVVHIHHYKLWEKYMYKLPTTDPGVEYGTPEMAYEVKRLFNLSDVKTQRIFIMGGHKEGIVSFGADCMEAANRLIKMYDNQK